MEKDRKKRIIISGLLIISMVIISIGFAAWSTTLTIFSFNSSTLAPSDPFPKGLVLSSSYGSVSGGVWSGLTADFYNYGSGNSCYSYTYTAKVENQTDYVAYLKSISTNNQTISCTALDTISSGNLSASQICAYITVTIAVDGASATLTSSTPMNYTASSNRYSIAKRNGSTYSQHNVTLTITLDNSVSIPDGDIKINIPNIVFSYTSLNK